MTSAPTVAAARPAGAPRRSHLGTLSLLLPSLLFLGVFFAYPLIEVLARGFAGTDGPTLDHYRQLFGRTIYLRVFGITLAISAAVTLITLVLAYPLAFAMATASRRVAAVLTLCVLLPFFTSMLVRTYAWMVMLGPAGVIAQWARSFGLDPPVLLYNRTGVLIGMTYTLLPYMVLTLYSVLKGIDHQYFRAAFSLGAGEWGVFRRILLPLSMPGVVGGSILVFILAMGFFIVPKLMGGDRDQMIATIIEYQLDLLLNWNLAAALSTVLLIATAAGFAVYARLLGLKSLLEAKI